VNPPMKKQIIMKANVHLEPFISSLPIKQSKMFELNLEFQLYNLENAAIRVHALYNSLWRIRFLFTTHWRRRPRFFFLSTFLL